MSQNEFKIALFLGRLQPVHLSHVAVIKQGLSVADKVVIMLGSVGAAPNIKNPFSFEQRSEMIRLCFTEGENSRIVILGVRDYFYNEFLWISDIQAQLSAHVNDGDSKAILGHYKDQSSYYLKYFPAPEWEFLPAKTEVMDSTTIRDWLFTQKGLHYYFEHNDLYHTPMSSALHPNVLTWLSKNYLEPEGFIPGPRTGYMDRVEEYKFIEDYKKKHQFVDPKIPYKPTFVTVDSLVTCSGHVLLIKRKFNPGKGCWALPGGFVKDTETLRTAAIRELKEETSIRVSREDLDDAIVKEKLFDFPGRSLRGRTITNCYHFKLKDGKLPEIKAGDDAAGAHWVPFFKLFQNMDKFYEDHLHIIEALLNLGDK